ncbi:solute carrier family 35 member B1-like protein [Leptotrombidium deliense]|uniref:Solute carrier family 35 member B1-like protein n=1 Tax=Leptotrombidium deliense TaxID=299467 RepID=A0A443SUL7_9ACAR|nr:solute carrier family 35 member B1-like protein [Leptotrombidium deliense]
MQTKDTNLKYSSVIEVTREHKATVEYLMAQSNRKLIIYALGIFLCFFYFGILQEKITRTKYGESKEYFKCTVALVFIQCVINAIFAKIMLSTFLQQPHDTTRKSYYVVCAFTYLAAMVSSNMALIHVNYPTQVVGKSCKPIPVMLLGVLIGRKSYSLLKYLFVFTIVIGVGIFMYKDGSNKASSATNAGLIGAGEMLLLFSLLMDGFTGAVQERMKSEHQTKSGHMMLNMNLWSILFLGIALVGTGELWRFIDFVGRYPFVVYYILGFSILSAIGQLFIFLTVTEFGPLPCSIITTTRKFFTVLASVLLFGNVLSERQWLGAFMVFAGLTLDSIYGKSAPKTK